MLLLLDNLEQVVEAGPELGRLLAGTPHLSILATRLSVFAGGCTREAAERVAGVDSDVAQGFVGPSLLRRDRDRLSMLETIREYAEGRLDESGETEDVRSLHLAYFLDLARDADASISGGEQSQQLARLAVEHDNLRAVLAWALESEPEHALRLAASLQRFFYLRGYSAEGLRALEDALEHTPAAEASLRARALRAAGTLASGARAGPPP